MTKTQIEEIDARMAKIAKSNSTKLFHSFVSKFGRAEVFYEKYYDRLVDNIGEDFVANYAEYHANNPQGPSSIHHMLAGSFNSSLFRVLAKHLNETYISGYAVYETTKRHQDVAKNQNCRSVNNLIAESLDISSSTFIGNYLYYNADTKYVSNKTPTDYLDFIQTDITELNQESRFSFEHTDMLTMQFNEYLTYDDFLFSVLWLLHNYVSESYNPSKCTPIWENLRKPETPVVELI